MPLHHATIQIHHHHIVGGHTVILHAGGFDNHQPFFAVDTADIAPSKGDQPVAGQHQIRLQHLLFQYFQHSELTSISTRDRSGTGRVPAIPPLYPL
jgi:hypothetical protein